MKKFKLFAIAVLVLAMLVTLCACGGGEEDAPDTTTAGQNGDIVPNDTTTVGQNGDEEPNDTTTAGQGDNNTPDDGDTTTAETTIDPQLDIYVPEGEGNFYDINDLIG